MQDIVREIWSDKYRYRDEPSITATRDRVINGVYASDPNEEAREEARALIHKQMILPAGRIHAGAGTDKRVTLINCFVSPFIQDSMDTIPDEAGKGIMDALKVAALTQQMGGGIGMDFSTIRPRGAIVKRTCSVSTGVVPFMDMWNAMCGTVKSSGARRGAMMGTLACWHPDIEEFIDAKQKFWVNPKDPDDIIGRLKNFNVSILVTDPFMKAVEEDGDFALGFNVPRADGQHVKTESDENGVTVYVYKTVKARELWNKIINSTYIHAEPGVIFIDRVNATNNLKYCEYLHCTNPCGEQPLPPDGDCDLGHVNLAVMVSDPFSVKYPAMFDWESLRRAVKCMVRLLDNVLDVTQFPTEDQKKEALSKRRIGIGYTGLANALQQLGIRYGSPEALEFTRKVGKTIRDAAYWASVELAKERGPFPLFNVKEYSMRPFIRNLPPDLQIAICENGIRNGVLLTIAPTGTTSILAGNVSSGIEPVFCHAYDRKVLQDDGSFKTYTAYDWGALKYHEVYNAPPGALVLPKYFVTAKDLTVTEHLEMQAAAQEYVDASISKTINCPTEMTFEQFKEVYNLAYKMGLKGCTTYRYDPRSKRGAILTEKSTSVDIPEKSTSVDIKVDIKAPPVNKQVYIAPMEDVLEGRRYRIKWPGIEAAFYLQINDHVDTNGVRRPFEVFISTKNAIHEQWIKGITRMISAIFRRGGDTTFVAEELKQVFAPGTGIFANQQYVPSIVAMIGVKIEEHMRWLGLWPTGDTLIPSMVTATQPPESGQMGELCTNCGAPAVAVQEGCRKCMSCGMSDCG